MILAYHKINCLDKDPLTVTTEMFLRQLDYIEDRGFNFISPKGFNPHSANKRDMLLTFDDGYKDNYEVVYPLLKAKGISPIIFVVYNFLGQEGMLTKEELRIISESGFFVGSHTLSCPHLTTLSRAEAKKEIFESKDRLESLLNKKIEYFSYPYSDLNDETVELVKDAGYKLAFCTAQKRGIGNNLFTLKRCSISHKDNFILFKFKLGGMI